jgi:putative oxidoreductase
MKKYLFSTQPQSNDLAVLVLRVSFGLLMARYGLMKLQDFGNMSANFMDWLGLGPKITLTLVVFAELGCAVLVVVGLLTRLALIPLIITMLVAFFVAHANDTFDSKEHPLVFLIAYIAIFLMGAGRYSLDWYFTKK